MIDPSRTCVRVAGLGIALALLLPPAGLAQAGDAYLWVDEAGVTHLSDRPEPEAKRTDGDPADTPDPQQQPYTGIDELRAVWGSRILGRPTQTPPGSSSSDSDRSVRLLRGAVDDLRRGETARAAATLRSVLRTEPRNAEAHWYLALLDRQRGRYESSEKHLHDFLDAAGAGYPEWRDSAERRLGALKDERKLANPDIAREPLSFVSLSSHNFRVRVDRELDQSRARYADVVMDYLEEARNAVSAHIGVVPAEPLGVVLYGKAAYQKAHGHRFSFQTVGFFDGRIHVSSPAHPSGSLRSLLYHEYTHAIFREQTGGDRPYWFNEGLAERIERLSRAQPVTIRSERISLRTRLEAGQWIPLRRLAPSFSGLSDVEARAAYLEAVLALQWIEANTDREQRALLLKRLGQGMSIDQALFEVAGVDTEGLDAALQAEIRAEFPTFSAADAMPVPARRSAHGGDGAGELR